MLKCVFRKEVSDVKREEQEEERERQVLHACLPSIRLLSPQFRRLPQHVSTS
jgi:hypothetical protein